MSARTGTVSDADPVIARDMAAAMQPWPDALEIDTESGGVTGQAGAAMRRALAAIRPPGPGHAGQPARGRTGAD